ncbi:MAG: arsenate reductase (glutaredoxin) [Alphaproteobacteria bacterium]|nr:arsenate reductase (glutaredoxin) [Alphaproteobacteria bacterium]
MSVEDEPDEDDDTYWEESVEIYYNPKCSKCRQVLQLLRDRGIEPEIIEYLVDPPDQREMELLLERLEMEPREVMRTKEPAYKELGLNDATLSRESLIRAMVENPILIERPIVVVGNRICIGRPPENVLKLL